MIPFVGRVLLYSACHCVLLVSWSRPLGGFHVALGRFYLYSPLHAADLTAYRLPISEKPLMIGVGPCRSGEAEMERCTVQVVQTMPHTNGGKPDLDRVRSRQISSAYEVHGDPGG